MKARTWHWNMVYLTFSFRQIKKEQSKRDQDSPEIIISKQKIKQKEKSGKRAREKYKNWALLT